MNYLALTLVRVVSIAALLIVAAVANAQDAAPPHQAQMGHTSADSESAPPLEAIPVDPWRIEFNMWIWIMSLHGDVGIRDRSAEVDATFGDILDASDSIFAFAGRLEIGYKRFGVFADGFYSDLGVDDASGPAGAGDIDVTLIETIVDFGAMYRLIDQEPSGDAAKNRRNFTIDLYAGARYTNVEVTLDPETFPERTHNEDWFDPILGAKFIVPLAEHWHISTNADIGGFGVGSDITWSATALVGYDFLLFDHSASVMLGYRAIGWDFSSDDESEFQWDIIQHGIILSFTMNF